MVGSVLILFLLGIIEAGVMLWTWQALQATADDTSRCVAIASSRCPAAAAYAVQRAAAYGISSLTTSEVTVVNPSSACQGAPSGTTMIQVSVSLPFTSETPLLVNLLPKSLTAVACYPSAT